MFGTQGEIKYELGGIDGYRLISISSYTDEEFAWTEAGVFPLFVISSGCLQGRSFSFVSTAGNVSSETIRRYIEEQRGRDEISWPCYWLV